MVDMDRRSILLALAAISVAGCSQAPTQITPGHPMSVGLDPQGLAGIVASFEASSHKPVSSSKYKKIFANGNVDLDALEKKVSEDFRNKRVFKHQGWYLSHTEGRLFKLLSAAI